MRRAYNELPGFLVVVEPVRLEKEASPMLRLTIKIVLLVLGWVVPAQADYEDGQRAWDAGRHSEALREWQAAANAGEAKAMLALGRLYVQGLGAPQNYVQAHMWFSLAASKGEAEAVAERDALAEKMTPGQVAQAQERTAAWRPGETQLTTAPSPGAVPTGTPPQKAIREAQELLATLGYEPDPPDGQWGERTAQAYQAFVRDANLPVTETLTPAALQALRAMVRKSDAESASKATLPPEALHVAAKAGNLNGLETALDAGADVNARDDKGWTALMYLADHGYVLLVEPLLKAKADPNARGPDGATALFIAAVHGHSEIITMLMKAGADPTIKGPKAKTATEVAQAQYGDLKAAREKGENAAVIALLKGQTWEQAEDEAFARARSQGTPEAYAEYLSAFPHGRHADEAKEEVAFARADSLWTVEAYAEYLASYPSGRHVEKARRRQAALERESLLTAISPAGTTVRECVECPEMVVVPAGRFRMGDLYGEGDSDEKPVHEVTIEYPFAVGRYEVTFAEWDACVAGGGCTHRPGDKGWGRENRPVIYVSWDDAQEYVAWLSRETGKPYRLLSEAEWEYMARAGTRTIYWWGGDSWLDDDPHDYANYGRDKCCEGLAAGADRWVNTSPVGSFEANVFGLFDTAGNVWEWVEDCWNKSYEGATGDGSAWTRGNCDRRVLRGGSWFNTPWDIRSANRNRFDTGNRYSNVGFRVARTLD